MMRVAVSDKLAREELQDPTVLAAYELIVSLLKRIDLFVGAAKGDQIHQLNDLAEHCFNLEQFRNQVDHFTYNPDFSLVSPVTEAMSGLNYLLTNSGDLQGLFSEIEALLVELSKKRRLRGLEVTPAEDLALLRADYERLVKLATAITLGKLKLQLHCQSFVTADRDRSDGLEPQRVMRYRSLLALRDQYFLVPRAGLLAEYLKLVNELSNDPFYTAGLAVHKASWQHYEEVMERYVLDLEVLSLLEGASVELSSEQTDDE